MNIHRFPVPSPRKLPLEQEDGWTLGCHDPPIRRYGVLGLQRKQRGIQRDLVLGSSGPEDAAHPVDAG